MTILFAIILSVAATWYAAMHADGATETGFASYVGGFMAALAFAAWLGGGA